MRLLLDTTSLLDFVGNRPSAQENWKKLNAMQLTQCVELWASSETINQLRSRLIELVPEEEANNLLIHLLDFVNMCSLDVSDVITALQHKRLSYHEALDESCARKLKASYLITNAGPSPLTRGVKRVSLDEFFSDLEETQGISFALIDLNT
jgi:uncharacterized membrane protein YheB (UPF0754 family)